MKNDKKCRKAYVNISILYFELAPIDPWCDMLQILEIQKKYRW